MSKKIIHYIPYSSKTGDMNGSELGEDGTLSKSAISAHVKDLNSKPVPFEQSLRLASQDSLMLQSKFITSSPKVPQENK